MKPKKDKFPELMQWFDFMNEQFQKVEDAHNNSKINNLLFDNDIDLLQEDENKNT